MSIERLQKILARGGWASRRAAESMISAGRVRVNGHVVTELGTKADSRRDRIEVDGVRVVAEKAGYYVLNKPRGYVTTLSDPEGRPTIADLIRTTEIEARVFPVGRLDFNTSGVLLLTNDGDFSEGMMHPKKLVPKTYVVKVQGTMGPEDLERWRKGVMLEDGITLPALASLLRFEEDKTWLELTIREGRNQQIRRMGDATGFRVMRLSRVVFAGVTVEGLRPGDIRALTRDELLELKKSFGVPKNVNVTPEISTSSHSAPSVVRHAGDRSSAPRSSDSRDPRKRHGESTPRPARRGASETRGAAPLRTPQRTPDGRGGRPRDARLPGNDASDVRGAVPRKSQPSKHGPDSRSVPASRRAPRRPAKTRR